MYPKLSQTIDTIALMEVSNERKIVLQVLIDYIQPKVVDFEAIRLNFICTHNSRRSHLSQVWAQTMAHYFGLTQVYCYSGGTEATAMFSKVAATLALQGFQIQSLSEGANPVYALKYTENEAPIICFSKTFDDAFNPSSHYAAIMTCSTADEGCPFIAGADQRLPIRYDDPKTFDGTELMDLKYQERSLEIAAEMYYVFSQFYSKL